MPEKFLNDDGLRYFVGALNAVTYTTIEADALLAKKAANFTPRTTGVFAGCSTLEQLVTRLESIFAGNTRIDGIDVK